MTKNRMLEKIKVAIIGYGMSAKVFHAPLLHLLAEFEIVAFLERNHQYSQIEHPQSILYNDYETLLKNEEIDLVVITSPNQIHFSQVKLALEAGKHVVVEKPMCITVEEGEELIVLSERTGKMLSVFHNRRWDSDFLWLQKLVNSDVKIYEIESRFDRFRDYLKGWKEFEGEGNGVVYDLGSHLIDQMICLFGDDLKLIYFDLREQREVAQTTDYFELHFVTSTGIKIILKAGMCCAHSNRLKVDTSKGTFIKEKPDGQEMKLKEVGIAYTPAALDPEHVLHYKPDGELSKIQIDQGTYEQFYKEVYDAIRKVGKNPVSGREANEVIKMIGRITLPCSQNTL